MAAKQEKIYFEDGKIKITDKRVKLNKTTYPTVNISSIATRKINPDRTWPGLFLVLGLAGGLCALTDEFTGTMIGVMGFIAVIAAVFILAKQKKRYAVHIGSASGEMAEFISTDRATINHIVNALNQARIERTKKK